MSENSWESILISFLGELTKIVFILISSINLSNYFSLSLDPLFWDFLFSACSTKALIYSFLAWTLPTTPFSSVFFLFSLSRQSLKWLSVFIIIVLLSFLLSLSVDLLRVSGLSIDTVERFKEGSPTNLHQENRTWELCMINWRRV